MTLATDALDAIAECLPGLVAEIRYAGTNQALNGTIESVLCTGFEKTIAQTEQGMYDGTDGVIRYKESDEPAAWGTNNAIAGQPLEIKFSGSTTWQRVRAATRRPTLGAVRLNVIAEFEAV